MKPFVNREKDKYYVVIDYVELADGNLSIIKQYDITDEIEKILNEIKSDIKKIDWRDLNSVRLFSLKWGIK